MEKLYDPQNIRKFAGCIVAAVQTSNHDHLDSLLNVLKVIVNGPPGERCQAFYGSVVPADRCLAAALSSIDVQSALKDDSQLCQKLIDILMGLPYLTIHLCRAVGFLLSSTQRLTDQRKQLVGRILRHHDLYKFELATISTAVREDTSELEMSLIDLCTHDVAAENIQSTVGHWIKWCTLSPEIFQTFTGILHQILITVNCKLRVLRCIDLVVKQVHRSCDQIDFDFVSLYPCEVQSLVGLLLMSPGALGEENFLLKNVQTKFSTLQKRDPSIALLLTSHFPEWVDFIHVP